MVDSKFMKRKIIGLVACLGMVGTLVGCGNRTFFDTVYTYNYAIIQLADGTIVQGEVETWTDYDDGEQLQITIDGITYLTNSLRCDLLTEKPDYITATEGK